MAVDLSDTTFMRALEDRILVFDGGMGTSIQRYTLTADDFGGKEGCNEYLVLTRPSVIQEIHASFFRAGCDAVETDTFGASSIVLAEYALEGRVYEINKRAGELAREVAHGFSTPTRPRYVIGSIGPTTKLPSLGHISYDAMLETLRDQALGLIDGGVDVLLIETCQDILQAKAAIAGVQLAMRQSGKLLPVMVQVTIERMGTMLVGTEIGAALAILEPYDIQVIGLNCATGPKEMNDSVRYLGDYCTKKISCLPNAGMPENVGGQAHYKLTPDELAAYQKRFVKEYGVNIVGGCCGTTPEHLRRVVEEVSDLEPKRRAVKPQAMMASCFAATQLRQEPPPLIIAEELNTTTRSKVFRELVQGGKYDDIVAMAKRLVNEGSHVLDLCVAIVGEDELKYMREVVTRLATRVTVPLMIDSTEANVIEEALKLVPGKAIVNSINMEDGMQRIQKVVPFVRQFGAAVVALTIDEEGMALTAEKKIAIAKRIYRILTEDYGVPPRDILFDALTLPISTGQEEYRSAGVETLNAVKGIKEELPECITILGVSNISFGLETYSRRILNSVFLHEALEHGLDAAIVNWHKIYPLYKIPENEVELCRRLIYCDRSAGADPLQDFINYYQGSEKQVFSVAAGTGGEMTIEERLKYNLINGERVSHVNGRKVELTEFLDEALKKYSALDIINSILLDGMKVVGDLFGSGKMQLPSVLDAAQVMKAAVNYLEQFMDKAADSSKGSIVLATVKGDVHDIGKNLVDIILTNNGYTVYNLGIKQPSDNIIQSALEHEVDAIGLSGLLVKSTVEMKYVLEDLQRQGLRFPVLAGGAALTRKYVEEDMQSVYGGPVFYGQDAFAGLHIMDGIMDPGRKGEIAPPVPTRRKAATACAAEPRDAEVAAADFTSTVTRDVSIPRPPFFGRRVVRDLSMEDIFPFLNEVALFRNQWGIRGVKKDEYLRLIGEKYRPVLEQLKVECLREGYLEPRVVYGYFACQSDGNDLIVYDSAEDLKGTLRFTFPRQSKEPYLCLADYFAPSDSGKLDVLGLTVVTIGSRASEVTRELFARNEYTKYLYLHGLSVESAEALAEYFHKRIRRELGIDDKDGAEIEMLFKQRYRGRRYSLGYGACPALEDQEKIFTLLQPEEIGVRLTTGYQLEPEQSTSAFVVHHPQAKYFNI
ncbi:MAG: methionine synthase [Acidobacteria bacterium]|nr:MAG: methionine synthase [Acidobacteriota bacterium]